ncbi:Ribosomal RNA large subunit methyltransferase F [compost metagenome]
MLWFSSLVSKGGNLPGMEARLKRSGAVEMQVVEMAQGQKQSRFVAWTFLDAAQREGWRNERWKQR